MLRISAAAAACALLSACAAELPRYDLGKSIGRCSITFDTDPGTWYAIPGRDGAYWVVMTILVTTSDGRQNVVPLTAEPTDLRVPIPSFSKITSATKDSCYLFDSPPTLLSARNR